MDVNEFGQQIEELRSRFMTLLQSSGEPPLSQQEQLKAAFKELYTALEDLTRTTSTTSSIEM